MLLILYFHTTLSQIKVTIILAFFNFIRIKQYNIRDDHRIKI